MPEFQIKRNTRGEARARGRYFWGPDDAVPQVFASHLSPAHAEACTDERALYTYSNSD
jgi:hypothetical protein